MQNKMRITIKIIKNNKIYQQNLSKSNIIKIKKVINHTNMVFY